MLFDFFNTLIFSIGAIIILILILVFVVNLLDYIRLKKGNSGKKIRKSHTGFYDYY